MSTLDADDDRTTLRPAAGLTQGVPSGGGADGPTLPAGAPYPGSTPGAAPGTTPGTPPAAPMEMEAGNVLPAGRRLHEFELQGLLGEGGFGIVYIAHDHSLQRRVALKEYMPTALSWRTESGEVKVRSERHRETFDIGLRSFVNEARLLAMFDHPSLVKVYRFWEANGTAYMVMPLYEGGTLKDKLKRMGTPPDEAWLMSLLAPLTEALAVIHAESCYHRDIAPDNIILLAGSERPLLLDFGAARRVISDMTQALTVILKPGYAPVEQYAEVPDMKQGPWTDVYALAATVYFAITGRTPPTAVARLMNDTYQPLQQQAAGRYSPSFLQAIDRALQVRPADRTQSIDAFRADLGLGPADPSQRSGAHGGGGPSTAWASTATFSPTDAAPLTSAGNPTTAPPPRPALATAAAPARRSPGLVAAALGLVVLVGGGAAYLLSSRAPAPGATVASSTPSVTAPAPSPAPAPTSPTAAAPAPVSPAPPPATSPPTSVPFEIRDEFAKVVAGQTGDYGVQATPSRSTLRIGRDKLGFTVRSARDGFVHVLVLGPDGSLLLLFPNAQASDNRIKAGQTLTLPQASWPLETSEPAGREDFLIVVSDQPRDYSVLSKEREFSFLKLPTGRRGAELAASWTRSTPLLLGAVKSCPGARCEDYGAATFSVDVVH